MRKSTPVSKQLKLQKEVKKLKKLAGSCWVQNLSKDGKHYSIFPDEKLIDYCFSKAIESRILHETGKNHGNPFKAAKEYFTEYFDGVFARIEEGFKENQDNLNTK